MAMDKARKYILNKFKGGDGGKFEGTKFAQCLFRPTRIEEDGDIRFEDPLFMNKEAMSTLSKHFHDIVCLVGPPGAGKSTLASTLYNVQRSARLPYFEASGDAMESFTRGIWSLNDRTKCMQADRDKIDVLDLEGLESEDYINYLVVISIALSKAVLLCANYRGGGRFSFSMCKIFQAAVRLFKKYKINVPMPVVYIQVPDDQKEFKITSGTVDREGLINAVKTRYKVLKGCEVRTFSVPDFEHGNCFERGYLNRVRELLAEFKGIEEKVVVTERVKYAEGVLKALNDNSPQIISDMNLSFFKNELDLCIEEMRKTSIVGLRKLAESAEINHGNTSLEEWCLTFCSGPPALYDFSGQVQRRAVTLPFFDKDSPRHQKLIEDLDDGKEFTIDPKTQCADLYELARNAFLAALRTKGNNLAKLHNRTFTEFVDLKLREQRNKISYRGSTSLSYTVCHEINAKRHQLQSEFIDKTQDQVDLPSDYLECDVSKKWESQMVTLRSAWEAKKASALRERRKVTTSGDHKCPRCGKDHNSGCSHKSCTKADGRNTSWFWVDPSTQYCVCDGCNMEQRITSVCCWSCGTTLRCSIIRI